MSSNPYENEPGFEDANESQDKKNQKDYVQKVRDKSVSISEFKLNIPSDSSRDPSHFRHTTT